MLHKLGLPTTLLWLLLLLPAAQSARVRLSQHIHHHSRSRGHHYRSSPPTNELLLEYQHKGPHPHIQMVTMQQEAAVTHYQSIEGLANILQDTPVSGPNPADNSASLAMASQLLHPHNEENSHNVGDMLLHKPMSAGPNPGANNQVFAASLAAGSQQILAASSSPNPGGNSKPQKRSLIDAKSAQISARLVGESTSSGAKLSLFSMLPRTPVPPSGPSKSHNSVITGEEP